MKKMMVLGNLMQGNGINTYSTKKKMYPITSGTLAASLPENSTYYTGNSRYFYKIF